MREKILVLGVIGMVTAGAVACADKVNDSHDIPAVTITDDSVEETSPQETQESEPEEGQSVESETTAVDYSLEAVEGENGEISYQLVVTKDGDSVDAETLSDEDFKEVLAEMAETTAEDYSIAAVEGEDGETSYRVVPTKYAVYTDGERHHLMYGANEYNYVYGDFTSVSIPEYRIESISLPSVMVEQMDAPIILGKEDELKVTEFEKDVLYDTSSRYSTDEIPVYSIETRAVLFRTWSVPFEGAPEAITADDMLAMYVKDDQLIGIDKDFWEVEKHENGSYQYTCIGFMRDYSGYVGDNALVRYTTMIKDGYAYCYIAGAYNPDTCFWRTQYILRDSFKFQE